VLDNEYTVGTDTTELMYSPTPSIQSGIGFPLPSINGINPEGNLRVLLHNGLGSVYQYPFYDDIVVNTSELLYVTDYCKTSMFDNDFTPNFSICFNAPKVLFHGFQSGQTSNYIYNLHHQRETTTINQGSRLSAYFDLTELDFQKLSTRLDWSIYIKDNGYFYIEKVHNYNATKRTLTKVDLITADEKTNLKVLNPQPPIKPNILYDDVVTDFYTDVADDTNIVIGSGQVQIQGAYNFVTGDNVFIQGNQNTVNANGAKVMGDNNTVPAGLSKATVIGNEQTASKSGVSIQGVSTPKVLDITEDITVSPELAEVYILKASGLTITLPDPDTIPDTIIIIKDQNKGGQTVTASAGSIDNNVSVSLTNNESLTLIANSGKWNIL
jgi:hypothetical protein